MKYFYLTIILPSHIFVFYPLFVCLNNQTLWAFLLPTISSTTPKEEDGSLDLLHSFRFLLFFQFLVKSHIEAAKHGEPGYSCHVAFSSGVAHSVWHSLSICQMAFCSCCSHIFICFALRYSSLSFSVRCLVTATGLVVTALHPPFRICHWIVTIFDFFIFDFSGRSEYTYFFRRKVSASRILQVPDALFLKFFQKLFAVCRASNKNFSWPRCEIIR